MTSPFEFLSEQEQEALLAGARVSNYSPGETVLQEGSVEPALYILLAGHARVERDHMGAAVELNVMDPGEIFGELSFLDSSGASASVVAESAVEVKILDGEQLLANLESAPELAAAFYKSLACVLAKRLRRASGLVVPPFSWG